MEIAHYHLQKTASGNVAVWLRELKLGLRDNLEGQDGAGGGREVQEKGTYVNLQLTYVDVWQKPTQYCKAIIPQLKRNRLNEREPAC